MDDSETRAPLATEEIRRNASDATVTHQTMNESVKAIRASPTHERSSRNTRRDLRSVNIRNRMTPGIIRITVSGWLTMNMGAVNNARMVQGLDSSGFSIIFTKRRIRPRYRMSSKACGDRWSWNQSAPRNNPVAGGAYSAEWERIMV